ncbi:MAG: membrane protein insertion efficiency factor YidD [Oligoflexales bacterium]
MLFLISLYQRWLSPILRYLGAECRFYPSCSAYAHECYSRYGFIRATWMSFYRVVRCQPWCQGGIDQP